MTKLEEARTKVLHALDILATIPGYRSEIYAARAGIDVLISAAKDEEAEECAAKCESFIDLCRPCHEEDARVCRARIAARKEKS